MWRIRKKRIGIIGYGNMGSAIAGRIKAEYQVYVFDKDAAKIRGLIGINACFNVEDLIKKSDTIILAVKPQDFDSVSNEMKGRLKDKLVISIAAGITTRYLESFLGKVKVVRAMPNLPAIVGEGVSWLSKGKHARQSDLIWAIKIFENLGKTFLLPAEDMMAVATATSGSGPGFLGYQMEKYKKSLDDKDFLNSFIYDLENAAIQEGFPREQAKFASMATAQGTVAYVKISGLSAEELIAKVASPGGTTEAGLEALRKGGSLEDAVKAAKKRAEELSKKG